MMQISQGTIGTPWHQNYHSSSSTSDVSNYSHAYPRRSPDQYSSQGSMESLDHSGNYPPCHLLSPAKSISSIDQLTHLHNKRDSAYSSFSTSSSIIEYPPTSFSSQECSDTVATTPAQGSLLEGMRQADIRYVKTVYDSKRGISAEYEVNSSALLPPSGESQESMGDQDYDKWHNHPRSGRVPLLSWNQQCSSSHETDSNNLPHKVGAPMPPARSGSYTILRHYERPISWSSSEHNRYGRPQSSFPGTLKTSFPEEHLHTLLEKSPENSPPVKPKQSYTQTTQPGQPMLPTSIYPVPSPEPHFAQMPQSSVSSNGMLYPALIKEHGYTASLNTSDKIATLENGNQNGPSKNAVIFYQAPDYNSPPLVEKVETLGKFFSYKPHFISDSENLRGTSLRKDEPRISEGDYMLPSGKEGLCDNVQFSNHHTPRGLKIDESKLLSRPSEPKRAEFQESPNARLQTRPEREDLTEDSWNTSGKTSSSFLSLQPISPSTRRQNSQEIQVGPQEGNPDNRTACLINMSKMEQEPKKTVLERRDHSDQQTSRGRPEGGTKGPSSSHNSEPRHEVHRQTSNLTQRQFSSGNALHISHYGKPHFSVLEKVNKFEQREQGNWRPSSVSSYIYKTNNLERPPSRGSSMISLENHQREISFQEPSPSIGSINVGENLVKDSKKKPEAVSWYLPEHQLKRAGDGGHGLTHSESKSLKSAPLLQRSQSTFHLSNKVEEETLWRENRSSSPESPVFEVPLNQAYRNSIKDAQSRVLGATSFRRRDLDLGPSVASRARQRARQRPASAHLGLRSPETTSMSASPHIPKERHNITPTEGSPPREGPAALVARVGGRKRLTTDQKKRSYSEPEKINEVGVSGAGEPSACYPQRKDVPFGFPENTVANRRRIFEREGKACSTLNLSKPELKQFQQTALADYIQRKTGKRPSSSSGHRPESHSLNAASSMNSLQEQSPIPRRGSATLSIELIENLERNSPEAQVGPRDRSSSSASSHLRAERHWHPKMEPAQVLWLGEASGQPSHPQKVTWAPEKPFSLGTTNRGASKSMSAEDLLDRSDVLTVPFHSRSRSSPISDKKCQDMLLRGNSDYSLLGKVPSSLVGPGFRQFSHSGRSHEEKSSLPHYPGPHLGPHTVPNGSSVPMECSKILDSQRPTSRSSAFGPPLAAKQGPFVSAQTSGTNSTYSPRPYLHTERDVLAGRQPSPKQPQNPRNLEENSVEDLAENDIKKNKGPLPQRPPPPRVKWSQSLREDNLPEPSLPFGVPSQKHYPQHQSLSSTSTTCHPNSLPGLLTVTGKGSLPISESAFRAIPLPQEEDDDEVFVQESRPRPTPNPTFKTLPLLPPPPPPPSPPPLDLKAQDSNLEDFPPPPPPITYEALGTLSSETYEEETCTSKSKMMLAASQRASTSRPSSFIKTLGAKQTNLLSPLAAQNQPIGILGEQSSPEQMLPTQFPKLIQKPNNLTQELAKGSPGPEKTLEDISTETLAKQIVHQDKSLADILDPDSRMKTTMDLMEGLFPQGPSFLKENNIRKKAIQRIASFPVSEGKRSTEKERVGMLINCPAYYNVSAPKAELLNKLKSMPAEGDEDEDQLDVNEKKAKLIRSLRHKLESLKEAKESLFMDIKLNNALGEEVEVLVCKLCKPNELDKYKMFVGDLDKVVNLLLSLSGRLARVENVLSGLGEDADSEEWSSLNEKKKVLAGQHEDARELKENLDRRERVVLDILANYLTTEQLQDYQHFVKMKSTLLIEQRKLDDKIKLGQEQLNCLLESLPRDFLTEARTPAAPLTPETEMTPDGDCTFRSGLPPLISSL